MTTPSELPPGVELVRTTETFDNVTVPGGLLRAHRVAVGTWGRLVVRTGTLVFVFEDDSTNPIRIGPGQATVIPPGRAHHVEFCEPASFAVEFYRIAPAAPDGRQERAGPSAR